MLNERRGIRPYSGSESLSYEGNPIDRCKDLEAKLEAKLEENRATYEKKITYLKQEIEMKRLQNDNMKRLIEFREGSTER